MQLRPDKKFTRQQEADKRNEAWRALSAKEQLEIVKTRPGNSARQVSKLLQEILPKAEVTK